MPLQHSKSDAAFKGNVKTLMDERGKSPHVKDSNQALAIAYAIKRRGRAAGGPPPASWQTRNEARGMTHSGPILSAVAGRTDHHPMAVASGSYILPADHVSSLGQGNTVNGLAVLGKMFGGAGPYGVGKDMGIAHGSGAPRPPKPMTSFAAGGTSDTGGARGDAKQVGKPVEIVAAGGEYVIPPHIVLQIGHGDIARGHKILDKWVIENRKKHVKTLQKLPGPAKA